VAPQNRVNREKRFGLFQENLVVRRFVGMVLRAVLPERHLCADSKDTVRLGMGMIATMAALVLGLLVASAKSFYDTQSSDLTAAGGEIVNKIQALSPQNHAQRAMQAQASGIAVDLGKLRWLMLEQESISISIPLLAVLVFWLAIVFASFGLFAPPNATVIGTLFLCALSVSGAIFLILEMYTPFKGLIQISDAPLRTALAHLGQ
jgi:hypothetical protein